MDLAQLSDEELLTEFRRASADARRPIVDELFARHYERVARWCYRFSGDRDAAADLAQEVFLKAYKHLDTFRGASRFSTWLYSIVRNESYKRLQRIAAIPAEEDEDALVAVPTRDAGPEEIAERDSRARHLHEFLASTLDETERVVFTLHYGDDLPLDSITRLLKLDNVSGAKAYIVSAKRKLARAVQRLRARGEEL
jgi:RNA polymerase sigma-70 factor (ECF subfamily)